MKTSTKKIDSYYFLSMLFVTIMLATYVLAYKLMAIGHFIESGGIFIFPINYAITDVITEVYGLDQTKKLIKYSFFCCLFFSIVVPLIAITPAPTNWPHQLSYHYVLGNVFRFFIANTIGIAIGIFLNSYLIAKWKLILNGRYFWLRSIGASSIGELITSIIADIIAFYGTANSIGVIKLMAAIYFVKAIYALILAWPMSLLATHLKLKENMPLLHPSFDFNPFTKTQPDRKNYAHDPTTHAD